MHHQFRAVVRSTADARAARPATRVAADGELLFEALATRRADTLRIFIICQLVQHDSRATARAFLAHVRVLRACRGAVPEAGWLVGIAGAVVRELARGTAHELRETAPAPGGAATGLAALAPCDRLRVAHRLSAHLASLGDELHDLLLLVAMDELSIDDAGLLLRLPVETAHKRLDRATRALDRRLHPAPQRAAA